MFRRKTTAKAEVPAPEPGADGADAPETEAAARRARGLGGILAGALTLAVLAVFAMVLNALAATPAHARTRAPDPARAVATELYAGRWYEIARTPNTTQKDCSAPTSDFDGFADGAFTVTETCHRGAPDGPAKVIRARARLVAGSQNTRFRMSFFGGLVHQEYWILDYAPDNSWLIMATPGGNYVWLMARQPGLPGPALAAAKARVAALGYPPGDLIFRPRVGAG